MCIYEKPLVVTPRYELLASSGKPQVAPSPLVTPLGKQTVTLHTSLGQQKTFAPRDATHFLLASPMYRYTTLTTNHPLVVGEAN